MQDNERVFGIADPHGYIYMSRVDNMDRYYFTEAELPEAIAYLEKEGFGRYPLHAIVRSSTSDRLTAGLLTEEQRKRS